MAAKKPVKSAGEPGRFRISGHGDAERRRREEAAVRKAAEIFKQAYAPAIEKLEKQ